MSKSTFRFELTGMKEMMNLLEQLPTVGLQKSVLRNALLKSGEPMKNLMWSSAPHSGKVKRRHLRETIEVSTRLKPSQKKGKLTDRTKVEVYVGSTSPLAHLVEFGTVERRQTATGRETGHMPANPWARAAWDATKHQALEIFQKEVWAELLKTVRKLRKKAEKGTLGKAQLRGLLK